MSKDLYTLFIASILFLIISLIIWNMIKEHKRGLHPACGCKCSSCGINCMCKIQLPKKL